MTVPLLLLMFAAAIALYGFAAVAHGRIRQHGFLVLVWRWLTGAAWHGKPLTDAGWRRPGERALTRTGHATRWQHLPRWKRTMHRSGSLVAVVAAAYGMTVAPNVTLGCLAAAVVLAAAWGTWKSVRAWRVHKHRRSWLLPTHVAVAPLLGIPIANRPEDWLQVEPDRSKAVLALPHGYIPKGKEKDELVSALTSKLALEAPEARWALAGPKPTLTLEASQPPPAGVALDDLRDAITQARADELVLGVGKRGQVVKVSLSGDSPHIGLSMASGAGKSILARLLAAQVLYTGGLALFLDPKRISHAWARGLPNVGYAKTPEQIHRALLWLQDELDRRNEVADIAADVEGTVRANVGPRLFIVVEELNMLQPRLKAHWRQVKEPGDPARSPAADALDSLLFAGRQARIHCLEIGQRLSAAATGGGDARENLAVRILGRYSASVWKLLAPEHPMPPASRAPGRVQVVDHRVRETQAGMLTGAEARELALAGEVAVPPPSMPYVTRPAMGESADSAIANPGSDQPVNQLEPVPDSPPVDAMSLRDAHELGILSGSLAGVRTARQRHPEAFPEPVGHDGLTKLYDADQLAAWNAER